MQRNNLLIILMSLCLFVSMVAGAAEFKKVAGFSNGENTGQLFLNATISGGVPDGPFQGPMAFICDRNGNFWIADTLNGRIVGVAPDGKQKKEIQLEPIQKALGLASDVVLLDMTPGAIGKLLVADANNNAVIEIDVKGAAAPRVFLPSPAGRGFWVQINRIHCDRSGRIYIEDLPSMRTVVLSADGDPVATLDGELSLAVSPGGRVAMLVMDTSELKRRHVVLSPVHGSPVEKIASIEADEEIVWASVIGFDRQNRLHLVYDTNSTRYYTTMNSDGKVNPARSTAFVDPGYDPTRPDWISPDGRVFTVRVIPSGLEILELQ